MGNSAEFFVKRGSNQNFEIERDITIVQHFMPPTFPIAVNVTSEMISLCKKNWYDLKNGLPTKMLSASIATGKTGIVLVYDDFFERLFLRSDVFKRVFKNIRTRGKVLVYAAEFILSVKGDQSSEEVERIHRLGSWHRTKPGLRAWQFSVYIQTFLETIMFWLGSEVTFEVAESWTNISAYIVGKMLQSYLPKLIDEIETDPLILPDSATDSLVEYTSESRIKMHQSVPNTPQKYAVQAKMRRTAPQTRNIKPRIVPFDV